MGKQRIHARAVPVADGREQGERATDRRAAKADPTRALGNLALQELAGRGLLHAKLMVGAANDPLELDADRMADAVMAGTPPPCTCAAGQPPCPRCRTAPAVRRKPRSDDPLEATPQVSLGAGRPLAESERAFFEPRLGADLSAVRLHDNPQAAASADDLDARAFSVGSRIAFGAGEYRPDTGDGRRLLAHELAHVLQDGGAPVIRRQPASPAPLQSLPPASTPASGPMCRPEPQAKPEEQVCKAAPEDPAHPTVLNLTGPLAARVASFKELVKTTAIHRLMSNQRNLGSWEDLVRDTVPAEDIAAMGMLQSGARGPYFELQDIRDPMLRELRAAQALGQFRACTGCHIQTQISASRTERQRAALGGWATPTEMRAGLRPASRFDLFPGGRMTGSDLNDMFRYGQRTGASPAPSTTAPAAPSTPAAPGPSAYRPPAGSQEARLHGLFPDPATTRVALERAQPIMQALGPNGYQVLPGDLLARLEGGSAGKIREAIIAQIETRKGNYQELIAKIRSGDVGYEHFGPVIKSLYPLADAEVRQAIQDEMDRNAFWAKVEQVVVAALSALLLLLAIFPPTSAVGISLFASLEVTMGYYALSKAPELERIGQAYSLGTGAYDVFTREQQQAGDTLILASFLSTAGGFLGIGGGLLRGGMAVSRAAPVATSALVDVPALAEGAALARTGPTMLVRTFQQGEFVITITEDGAMFVTVASRPDLVIMVRGQTATLYQLLEGGGMRVAATATIPQRAAGGAPLLAAAPEAEAAGAAGAAGREGPIITPPPREQPQLGSGNPTTYTWEQISRMRQPQLWEERQFYIQQVYGAPGEMHFPVPGTGGRYVDVPVQYGGGRVFAGEVKSYIRWRGTPGVRGGVPNEVPLSDRIRTQIDRDVWLRENLPGYDPRWIFTDAPPSPELLKALYDNKIVSITHLP